MKKSNLVNPVKKSFRQGFSLTEMLIATGIMAIGLVMVATIFPVGVKLTTLTTERTIGSVVADEAFAKIQLYGLRDFEYWPVRQIYAGDPNETNSLTEFQYASLFVNDPGSDGTAGTADDLISSNWLEFQYPSSITLDQQDRNYHWSALCRRMDPTSKNVQVTVFVTRSLSSGVQFRAWNPLAATDGKLASDWPQPVPVSVDYTYSSTNPLKNKQLILTDPQPNIYGLAGYDLVDCKQFFNDGYTIVDNRSGRKYRILEVDHSTGTLTLQKPWEWDGDPFTPPTATVPEIIWVVPPAVGSDRYPCIRVYQKTIYFEDIN